jgi:hypothetical protein
MVRTPAAVSMRAPSAVAVTDTGALPLSFHGRKASVVWDI